MKKNHNYILNQNNYKILDLTMGESEDSEEDSLVICSHCETGMIRASENITLPSDNSVILVNKDEYYCKQCGLVKDQDDEDKSKKSLNKKRENTGPRISKRNQGNNIFFKNIRSTQHLDNHEPTFLELEEEREEQLMKSQGSLVGSVHERRSNPI